MKQVFRRQDPVPNQSVKHETKRWKESHKSKRGMGKDGHRMKTATAISKRHRCSEELWVGGVKKIIMKMDIPTATTNNP